MIIVGGASRGIAAGGAVYSGGEPFAPDFVHYFDGTNNTSIGEISLPNSAHIETSYANGYGGRYSSAVTRGGRATSARFTIPAGSDGDPYGGDTGVGYGRWGANIALPTTARCVAGDTLHTVLVINFDAGFNSWANTGLLKFLRFLGSPNSYGHIDLMLHNTDYISGSISASPQWMTGWYMDSEAATTGGPWEPPYGFKSAVRSNRLPTRGTWCTLELRQYFSTNAATASRTLWLDGQFVMKFEGNSKSFINASGQLETIEGGQEVNISSGVTIDLMRLFTYWNGYSPANQGVYVDAIAYHKIASGGSDSVLPATDAYNNRLIGVGVV